MLSLLGAHPTGSHSSQIRVFEEYPEHKNVCIYDICIHIYIYICMYEDEICVYMYIYIYVRKHVCKCRHVNVHTLWTASIEARETQSAPHVRARWRPPALAFAPNG